MEEVLTSAPRVSLPKLEAKENPLASDPATVKLDLKRDFQRYVFPG